MFAALMLLWLWQVLGRQQTSSIRTPKTVLNLSDSGMSSASDIDNGSNSNTVSCGVCFVIVRTRCRTHGELQRQRTTRLHVMASIVVWIFLLAVVSFTQ